MHVLADGSLNQIDILDEFERAFNKIQPKKYILEPHCTSYTCTGIPSSKHDSGIIKKVSIHTTDCPDCGSAIFWRKREIK